MSWDPEQLDFMIGIMLVVLTPFLSHVVVSRLCPGLRAPGHRQRGVAISAALGLLPVVSWGLVRLMSGLRAGAVSYLPDLLYLVLLYGVAAYVYFHFFNMSDTARRIRILVAASGEQGTPFVSVPLGYTVRRMIENRLERLLALGELTIENGRYRIGRGVLLPPARMVAWCRRLLFVSEGQPTTPWSLIVMLLVATLFLAVAMARPLLPAPYDGIAASLLCALVGAMAFCLLSPRSCLKNYLLAALPYLFITLGFVLTVDLPQRDSLTNHFPVFQFFAEAVAGGFGAPTWLPVTGGVEVGYYHINYFPFLPHRLVGYCLTALLPVSLVTAYKIQLVLGALFCASGWYALIARLTRSQHAAYLGVMAILLGGTGITFHQEQVIATCHLLPWFALCLLKLREQPRYILPAGALFGLGMSTHYPQIQLIAMSLVAVVVLLGQRTALAPMLVAGRKFYVWAALLALLGSLPSLYLWSHGDTLASAIRDTETLQAPSYEVYAELNKQQMSSALPWYFNQYLRPYHEEASHRTDDAIDLYGMFVGRVPLLLGLVGLVLRPVVAVPVLALLALFAELTMGINSHLSLPKLLFEAGFPFINVFRQWYHFFPLVNFGLSLLAAFGFAGLIGRSGLGAASRAKKCGVLAIIFINFFDLAYYDWVYLRTYCRESPPAPMQHSLAEPEGTLATFQYKDRFRLTRDCRSAIPTTAFITSGYSATDGGIEAERSQACEREGGSKVVTNIPPHTLPPSHRAGGIISAVEAQVTPSGVNYQVEAPVPALLVAPVNYSLGAAVYVDGQPTRAWRVNGAVSGVLLAEGGHHVEFRKAGGWYSIIAWLQVMLYGWVGLMLALWAARGQRQSSVGDRA